MKVLKDRRLIEYFGALLLIILLALGVYLIKEHYVKQNNLIFEGSYVEIVTDKSNYKKITRFKEVDEVVTGLKGIVDSKMAFLISNEKLVNKQVIVPSWLVSENASIIMEVGNNVYNLDVESYTGDSLYCYEISQDFYDELLSLTNERVYRITLKDYSKLAAFTKKLEKLGSVNGYEMKRGENLNSLRIWQSIYKVTLGCLGIMLIYGLLLALSIIKKLYICK